MKQYRVSGLIDEQGNEIPDSVVVTATCRAMAKLEAANAVGGYWTEDTEAEEVESDGEPRRENQNAVPSMLLSSEE